MSSQESASEFASDFSKRLHGRYPNSYWPKCLFHYADLENALSILSEDAIYSRNLAKEKGVQKIDSAGQDVIGNTDVEFLDYARLYFRPKTPPLWHVEGFIPNGGNQKHCPVPIYFLFKWDRIFGLQGVRFSNCNLASTQRQVFDNVAFLESMNFGLIYHDTYLPNDDPVLKDNIIKARCAEVIVPCKIPIQDNLFCIVCRSVAERETLLNSIGETQRREYSARTVVRSAYFHNRWQYVASVRMQRDVISLSYAIPGCKYSYSYVYRFAYDNKLYERLYERPMERFTLTDKPNRYEVTVLIDGHVAYKGIYQAVDSPF